MSNQSMNQIANSETKSNNVIRSIYIPLNVLTETEEAAFMLDSSVSGIITTALVRYLESLSVDIPSDFPDTMIDSLISHD